MLNEILCLEINFNGSHKSLVFNVTGGESKMVAHMATVGARLNTYKHVRTRSPVTVDKDLLLLPSEEQVGQKCKKLALLTSV